MEKKNKGQASDPDDIITYSKIIDKFKTWVLSLNPSTLKKYAIFSIIIIIALPGIATLLSFPRFLEVLTSLPAAIGLFALGMGVAIVHQQRKPNWIPIKERYSFSQRLKASIFGIIVFLAFMVPLTAYIPYAYGGVIVCAMALGLYNTIMRTPMEIHYDEEDMMDPRDEKAILAREQRSFKTNKKRKSVDDE